MADDPLPQPETCAHNLYRVGEGRRVEPEATDLCRNALGVFHMLDCPLTYGLACTYYEAAAAPHPTTSDLDLEAAHEEMQRDFLGWRYRRRVRALTKPKNLVPVGIVVETTAEPEEVVPETLVMRAPPPTAEPAPVPAEGGAPAAVLLVVTHVLPHLYDEVGWVAPTLRSPATRASRNSRAGRQPGRA
jgi:hypothetical protein